MPSYWQRALSGEGDPVVDRKFNLVAMAGKDGEMKRLADASTETRVSVHRVYTPEACFCQVAP